MWVALAWTLTLAACERPAHPVAPSPPAAAVAAPRRSTPIAIHAGTGVLAVVNPDQDSITFLDLERETVRAEVAVGGEPTSVAFSEDGARAYVTCARDAVLSVVDVAAAQVVATIPVGLEPVALVLDPGGQRAYVSELAAGAVGIVDLAAGAVRGEIPLPPKPHGLALTADAATLYVTHLIGGSVSAVDLRDRSVRALSLPVLPFDGRAPEVPAGVPNRMKAAALHPTRNELWLPATLSNSANDAQTQWNTTVFPALLILDWAGPAMRIDTRTLYAGLQVASSTPETLEFSRDGRTAYLLSSSSDDLTVLDAEQRHELRTLRDVGENPRGIALLPDGRRAYLFNRQVPEVSLVDLEQGVVLRRIRVSRDVLAPDVARGRRLFSTTVLPEIARERRVGCEACHFDGREDGQTWFFDFGPRRTQTLEGTSRGKGLLHHAGDRRDVQDFQETIRGVQGGSGLPPADLDALAAYVNSGRIRFWRNPQQTRDRRLTDEAARGRDVFERAGCARCHAGRFFTDASGHDDFAHPRLHDVGTFAEGSGRRDALDRTRDQISTDAEPPRPAGRFETSSLLGLWSHPPYLHHGGAATLADLQPPGGRWHGMVRTLPPEDVAALVVYLLQL